MKLAGENIIFETTGRESGGNCGIIGIDTKGEVFGGYDQSLFTEWDSNPLTPAERKELAEHMIGRWQQFATVPK